MENKNKIFRDVILYKDVKNLVDLLVLLTNSYRQLVASADEFNRISLVSRHDCEEAIDRADELGEIIDDVQDRLKKCMKTYLNEVECKVMAFDSIESDYLKYYCINDDCKCEE